MRKDGHFRGSSPLCEQRLVCSIVVVQLLQLLRAVAVAKPEEGFAVTIESKDSVGFINSVLVGSNAAVRAVQSLHSEVHRISASTKSIMVTVEAASSVTGSDAAAQDGERIESTALVTLAVERAAALCRSSEQLSARLTASVANSLRTLWAYDLEQLATTCDNSPVDVGTVLGDAVAVSEPHRKALAKFLKTNEVKTVSKLAPIIVEDLHGKIAPALKKIFGLECDQVATWRERILAGNGGSIRRIAAFYLPLVVVAACCGSTPGARRDKVRAVRKRLRTYEAIVPRISIHRALEAAMDTADPPVVVEVDDATQNSIS